jgi:hypothetical protein
MQERVSKNQLNDFDESENAMYRIENIFNSDVELDDSIENGAEQSFSEITKRINNQKKDSFPRPRA